VAQDRSCCKAGSLSLLRSATSDFCSLSRAMATVRAGSGPKAAPGTWSIPFRSRSIHVLDLLRIGRPCDAHRLRIP